MPNLLPHVVADAAPNPARIDPAALGGAMGQATQQLGQQLSQLGMQLFEAEQTSTMFRELAERQAQVRRDADALQDGDHHEAAGAFEKLAAEAKKPPKGLRGRFAEQYQARMVDLLAHEEVRVNDWVRGKQLDSARANGSEALRILGESAARADSEGERMMHAENARGLVDSLVMGGVYNAQEGDRLREQWLEGVRTADVLEAIAKDPAEAGRRLSDPGDELFRIPEVERQQYLARAANEHDALLRQQAAEGAAQKQAQGDAAMKALLKASAPGGPGLTMSMVEQMEPFLSPSEYKSAIEIVAKGGRLEGGGGAGSSPERYIELSNAASAGQNVGRDIDAAFASGEITRSERDGLVRLMEDKTSDAAKAYLVTAVKVPESIGDPGRIYRSAEAVRQFDDWILRNPESTRAEKFAKANQIARDTALIDLTQTELGLPKPSVSPVRPTSPEQAAEIQRETLRQYLRAYGMPPELADGTRDDFDVAAQVEYRDAMARMVADPEFRQQVTLARRWKRLLEQRAREAAAASAGGEP